MNRPSRVVRIACNSHGASNRATMARPLLHLRHTDREGHHENPIAVCDPCCFHDRRLYRCPIVRHQDCGDVGLHVRYRRRDRRLDRRRAAQRRRQHHRLRQPQRRRFARDDGGRAVRADGAARRRERHLVLGRLSRRRQRGGRPTPSRSTERATRAPPRARVRSRPGSRSPHRRQVRPSRVRAQSPSATARPERPTR